MYYLYKDDPWGNKVPYMAANHKDIADRLVRENGGSVTRVVEVPRNVQSLIMM